MATTVKGRFKKVRLHKVAKELNLTIDTIVEHLSEQGQSAVLQGNGVNAAITDEDAYLDLIDHFSEDKNTRARVQELRAAREAELAKARGDSAPTEIPEVAEPIAPLPIETTEQAAIEPVEREEAEQPELPEPSEPELEADPGEVDIEVLPIEVAGEVSDSEVAEDEAVPVTADTPPEHELSEIPEAEDAVAEVAQPAEATPVSETPEVEKPPLEGGTEEETEDGVITADRYKLQGTTIVGKIDLQVVDGAAPAPRRKKRKRKRKTAAAPSASTDQSLTQAGRDTGQRKRSRRRKSKVDKEEVDQTVQETLRTIDQSAARVRQRRRRARRQQRAEERMNVQLEQEQQDKVVRVTEFVSTGELADLMGMAVTDIIGMLFDAGMMVSINQRLDADTITFVADEFGFSVEFITEFGTDDIVLEADDPEDLVSRAPVVTVMGHVDHGKTSLLDYIRSASVAVGESGGITQHIGAYQVKLDNGREVTFLDTPGHEAFTAMRARGAKVTDVVILVVAANDSVMPQTVEAINHARAAEVPIIVAINKIDLPEIDLQRVMQQLSEHGVLVESFGGKVQCANVSAKTGDGIDDLLDKVLLEADLMELRGNPDRRAQGIVIESRLDRGRGNVATVLVQNGSLRVGDPFVAGVFGGRVRAMFDEWDQRIEVAGPSEPALVLGLPGQPTVGDQFVGVEDENEAKEISQRRQQIWREQKMRQYKHVRLEDIGRRMALGDFNELNLIIKADVGGSVEAISDALQKLSTDEVAVNIIHAGVGAITESDVMLASASDAVIIGFQVRPTAGARAAGEREEIDIHTYSIIYDAIEDVRDALEGLLQPEETEKVIGVADIREVFKVPKVGSIAGCYITEGRIRRNDTVHVLRESVVVYNGKLGSLKRFKDDVREVVSGYECGIGVENFNDIKVGDQIEAYEIIETKRTLDA